MTVRCLFTVVLQSSLIVCESFSFSKYDILLLQCLVKIGCILGINPPVGDVQTEFNCLQDLKIQGKKTSWAINLQRVVHVGGGIWKKKWWRQLWRQNLLCWKSSVRISEKVSEGKTGMSAMCMYVCLRSRLRCLQLCDMNLQIEANHEWCIYTWNKFHLSVYWKYGPA